MTARMRRVHLIGGLMSEHVNNMAEDAPIKVRFKHAGVDAGDGLHRPMCRPSDLKLQTVAHESQVTCPHCKEVIKNFKNWMALQEAAGRVPEDLQEDKPEHALIYKGPAK